MIELIEAKANRTYCPEISHFGICVMIDGSIDTFGFSGAQKVRYFRKDRVIDVEMGVPRRIWEGRPMQEIQKYYANCFREACQLLAARAEKASLCLDRDAFDRDVEGVAAAFENLSLDDWGQLEEYGDYASIDWSGTPILVQKRQQVEGD